MTAKLVQGFEISITTLISVLKIKDLVVSDFQAGAVVK